MPTDEELAKIARGVQRDYLRTHDSGVWHPDNDDEMWERIARALRAALCPPVAPLRPGETVTIPDAEVKVHQLEVRGVSNNRPYLSLGFYVLDAAGVAQLKVAITRWEATQGESDGHLR